MSRGRNSQVYGVRFPDELLAQLKERAAKSNMPFNQLIVQAIRHALVCDEFRDEMLELDVDRALAFRFDRGVQYHLPAESVYEHHEQPMLKGFGVQKEGYHDTN